MSRMTSPSHTDDAVTARLPLAMSTEDLQTLRWATQHLEHPSLAARLSNVIGTPIEIATNLLPRPLYQRIHGAADAAIGKAFQVAIASLRHREEANPRPHYYRALAAGTGAAGGLFGIYGLLFDLPLSTTIMLRSIAEIARSEGEDLHALDTRLACLEVFALGGHAESDDAAETGYYGIRAALAWPVTEAGQFIAQQGLEGANAPLIAKLIHGVASRFGVSVSKKAAAMLVPLIGAASGAAVNVIFTSHYQEMARGHFVVRRLERKYGKTFVENQYEALRRTADAN